MPKKLGIVYLAALIASSTAAAQMSFEGLDLSGNRQASQTPKKKKRKARREPRRKKAMPAAPAPTMMPGLDLSGQAPPAPPVAPAPVAAAPAPVGPPPLPRGKHGPPSWVLPKANGLLRAGSYGQAASLAFRALGDAGTQAQAAEAEYLLAKALYKMGLYRSALHHFSNVLARGEAGRYFKPSLEWLFFIGRKSVDDTLILDDVARWANAPFPSRYQDEFHYLLARWYLERAAGQMHDGLAAEGRASLSEAKRLAGLVPRPRGGSRPAGEAGSYYAKARFLVGTAEYQDAEIGLAPGQPASPQSLEPALVAFKDVVRVTNPRAPWGIRDWKTRDLAFMNLARIHFEARQNRNAVFYYGKVSRGGPQWLEALYEAAWAYYRMGDDEHALGNMVTLHAPFFADDYFPELLTVKAIIYYENCRYVEARAAIADFERIYGPVEQELARITAGNPSPEAFYASLDDIQRRQRLAGSNAILDRVLKLALSDEELKRRNASIQELQGEIATVEHGPAGLGRGRLTQALLAELRSDRQAARNKAGLVARSRLEAQRDELRDLLGKALRIQFETEEREKQVLERQLAGQAAQAERLRRYRHSTVAGAGEEYWPYEGEYWRDELGTYQYSLEKGCRQTLAAGTR